MNEADRPKRLDCRPPMYVCVCEYPNIRIYPVDNDQTSSTTAVSPNRDPCVLNEFTSQFASDGSREDDPGTQRSCPGYK